MRFRTFTLAQYESWRASLDITYHLITHVSRAGVGGKVRAELLIDGFGVVTSHYFSRVTAAFDDACYHSDILFDDIGFAA